MTKLFWKATTIGIVLSLMLSTGCTRQDTAKHVLTVAGSTTILPIATAAAEEFQKENEDMKVTVQGGGSSYGIEGVSEEQFDIGTASRNLKGDENKLGLAKYVIAIDAVAVIVNPSNRIKKLSKQHVKDIFTGKITNWKDLGGKDEEIIIVNRDEASGTREAFLKIALDEEDFIKESVVLPGTGQVRSVVANTPSAIGYISLGYVTDKVRTVEYEGVKPSHKTVKNGKYKLQRKLYMLTKGKANQYEKRFIDYILSPRIQKEIVSVDFLPVE